MKFTLTVEVEVERVEGKFASRDDILAELTEAVEGADPGTVDGIGADGASSYEVVEWTVVS